MQLVYIHACSVIHHGVRFQNYKRCIRASDPGPGMLLHEPAMHHQIQLLPNPAETSRFTLTEMT